MNIELFFKFPGILILIGIILLIIAIIIGILAYRKVDDDEKVFNEEDIDNEIINNEDTPISNEEESVIKEEQIQSEEIIKEEKNEIPEAEIIEDKTEKITPEITEEDEKELIIEDTVIKEDKEKLDNETFEDMIKKFDDAIEKEEFVELNTLEPAQEEAKEVSNDIEPLLKDFLINDNEIEEPLVTTFNNSFDNTENLVIEPEFLDTNIKEHQPIYGGINPLDNVKLDFNSTHEKTLYGDKNFVPSEPIIVDYEEKKPVIEDEEEIEML